VNDAYTQGFIDKCASLGIDPVSLVKDPSSIVGDMMSYVGGKTSAPSVKTPSNNDRTMKTVKLISVLDDVPMIIANLASHMG